MSNKYCHSVKQIIYIYILLGNNLTFLPEFSFLCFKANITFIILLELGLVSYLKKNYQGDLQTCILQAPVSACSQVQRLKQGQISPMIIFQNRLCQGVVQLPCQAYRRALCCQTMFCEGLLVFDHRSMDSDMLPWKGYIYLYKLLLMPINVAQ